MPTSDASDCAALMDELTAIVVRAAEAILALARQSEVRSKADGSPVTAADEAAEAIICEGLQRLSPNLPIISEEQAAKENPAPVESGGYFLVDPLDGTREFVAGRDEYTVNVALMTERMPQLGVICAPLPAPFGAVSPAKVLTRSNVGNHQASSNSRPATAERRSCRDGQPVASGCTNTSSCESIAARHPDADRIFGEILLDRRRQGGPLSAHGADPRLGHRRRARHLAGCRWQRHRSRWKSRDLWNQGIADPCLCRLWRGQGLRV